MSTTTPSSAYNADEIAANKKAADQQFAEAVQARFLEIAEDAGVVKNDKLVKKLLAKRVYEVLKPKRVVNIDPEDDDRRDPAKCTHKEELAEIIFPMIPSGSAADSNLLEAAVREKCLTAVWDMTATGADRGLVQDMLLADRLLLIRGVVFRGSKTIRDGVFVSTQADVVRRDLIAPRIKRARSQLDSLSAEYQMVIERAPELRELLEEDIEAFMVEATAKLPVATLTPGDSNGRKALGK